MDHLVEAARLEERARESFERCDTDGFVSQWADGIMANVHRLQHEIDQNDGLAEFPALFDSNGDRTKAKLCRVYNRFTYQKESVWRVEDADGNVMHWIPAFKHGKNSKMAKLGYSEGTEMAPAKAKVLGEGYGLSGKAWAGVVRTYGEGA